MKVGVITFHRAYNYGAFIQCYALCFYLKKLGFDVEVVDYRSKSIEATRQLVSFESVRKFFWSLSVLPSKIKVSNMFNKIQKNRLLCSKKIYYEAKDFNNEYDVIIIGSDQVWNKRITKGLDPIYWGRIPGSTKIISYAASLDDDCIFSSNDFHEIKLYLENFDAISVRESKWADIFQPYVIKPIYTVLDPSLLLTKEDYEHFIEEPIDKNYVLYYQMEYNYNSKYRVIEAANALNANIIVIGGKKEHYKCNNQFRYIPRSEVSPFLLLGYINNARLVFASTFHGTALPIALNKDVYFFANSKIERSKSLLESVGAVDRMINSDEELTLSTMNYGLVNEKLEKLRENARRFVVSNIYKE